MSPRHLEPIHSFPELVFQKRLKGSMYKRCSTRLAYDALVEDKVRLPILRYNTSLRNAYQTFKPLTVQYDTDEALTVK